MTHAEPLTDELLDLASQGDVDASERLFDRHRDRLRRMITVRLDTRLASRVDPSDVVQETLLAASKRLSNYLKQRPLPFYPWLRRIAQDELDRLQTSHIKSRNRSVIREELSRCHLSDRSLLRLAGKLANKQSSPSRRLLKQEQREQVRHALELMDDEDREILILRFLEQLPIKEVATLLGLSEGAVNMRQLRALKRLRALMQPNGEEHSS